MAAWIRLHLVFRRSGGDAVREVRHVGGERLRAALDDNDNRGTRLEEAARPSGYPRQDAELSAGRPPSELVRTVT